MYYNQELALCIEFGPVRDDSVRRGGAPPGSNPPCAGSWTSTRVTCDCLLPFVHPLLSQVFLSSFRRLEVHVFFATLLLMFSGPEAARNACGDTRPGSQARVAGRGLLPM